MELQVDLNLVQFCPILSEIEKFCVCLDFMENDMGMRYLNKYL